MNGWWQRAACRADDVNGEWFFPSEDDELTIARAKRVCAGCQVRSACLEDEMAHLERQRAVRPVGIFGGLTPEERLSLLRDRHATDRRAQ